MMARPAFVCLLLGLVTLAVFWPVRGFDFISLDDGNYVSANPQVQRGLTMEGVAWAFKIGYVDNWHPVTWLSHMLDATLFGTGATGPHLVNLLLHVGNSVLLFLLLRSLTGAHWPSAVVAGLFAVHPLHVESVAWISERKDVLSTMFLLLTLWAYVRYARGSNQCSVFSVQCRSGWYWGALGLFALGLMSKPMLVTAPFVMLLLDFWPLGRVEGKKIWKLVVEKIPFFVLSAASCVITVVAQRKAVQSFAHFPFMVRIENAFVAYSRYLGKMLWPGDLTIAYPPQPGHWPAALVIVAVVIVLGGCAVALWGGRKFPFVATGWFWFLGTLVPTIGLVQVGIQSLADRYTYVPSVGIFIVSAWTAGVLCTRWRVPKMAVGSAAVLLVGACAARTANQLPYWRNSETLFRHAIAVTGDNGLAHYSLGFYFFQTGRLGEAIGEYRQALQISPDSVELLSDLGAALDQAGEPNQAVEKLGGALRVSPHNALAHYRLGNALVKLGKNGEAIEHYQQAVVSQPNLIEARNNLAVALFKENKAEEATE